MCRYAVFLPLALVLAACGKSTDPVRFCTEIGCDSGIEIVLENRPAGAHRIEAYVYSQGPRYVYRCDQPSGCSDRVFFTEFIPNRVFVEVISDTGTQRYEAVPRYQEARPNGPECPPLCRTAVIRLPSDRLGA